GLRNDSDVSNLQEFLIDQGFLKGVQTGNYFLLTRKAVQQFQSSHNLRPTGYFGPLTRAVANKILAGSGSGGGGGVPSISQPFYSVEPAGPFLRGQKYDFNAKISNGKPNAQVLLFLERPDGSMKYDGIACLGSVTEKCALYTDASGSLLTASYELITNEGQDGRWSSWVTVGGVLSNRLYHTVTSSQSAGYLTIDPVYAELKIGGSQRIQAIFIPPRPACLYSIPACKIAEQAPYEVRALFSSSHPSIAEIAEVFFQCIQAPCEGGQVSVRGISAGEAIITASYTDSNGRVYTARMKVTVNAARQNLPPIISGLKGPPALRVGETGTWTIQARDPENGSLAYHITWGDEEVGIARLSQSPLSTDRIAQTATFTHVYTKTGTFAPLFVVVDEGNLSAQTSASVNVGGSTAGSITILSPNGGETWTKGTTQTIKWQDNTITQSCPVGAYCKPLAPKSYDIKLASYYPPCTG
ncbi:MAG: peptidoglycan-binding domain-containing protein, partial [Patescibacteria group bacterium]